MVAAGAGGEDLGTKVFTDRIMGAVISGFQFGEGKETSYANSQ
jgi:hypothetical protein